MKMKKVLLFCGMMVATSAFAEKYEAEDATFGNPDDPSKQEYTVSIEDDAAFSGGKYAVMREGSIIFNNVSVEASGSYILSVYASNYDSDYERTNEIYVNGAFAGKLAYGLSTDWELQTFNITLNKGDNTISIVKGWGWMNFDYIVVARADLGDESSSSGESYTSSSVEEPTYDFCDATGHTGDSVIVQNVNAEDAPFDGNLYHKLWYDSAKLAKGTFYSDGSFTCTVEDASDYLCLRGFAWDKTKTYKYAGGDIIADYKVVKQEVSGVDFSFVGVYGWMADVPGDEKYTEVEYYIVDNWLTENRKDISTCNTDGHFTYLGEYEIDGAKYDVLTNGRENVESITPNKFTFMQYFSIRKTPRNCGRINVSEHMRKWEELGLNMGNLVETKVLVEAGSIDPNTHGLGKTATGVIDFPYSKVYLDATTPGYLNSFKHEAESATLVNPKTSSYNPTVESSGEFSGAGFVNIKEGGIKFENISVDVAGKYNVIIHYTSDNDERKNTLKVNDDDKTSVIFKKSSGWADVSTLVKLKEGDNTISIVKEDGDWGWIDIDYILVFPYVGIPFDISENLVTENATGAVRKLYGFLKDNFGRYTISGIMTGDLSEYKPGADFKTDVDVADIYKRSGKYPALVGVDLMRHTGSEKDTSWVKDYADKVNALAKQVWKQGAIPAFCWHWRDPSKATYGVYIPSAAGNNQIPTYLDYSTAFINGTTEWDTESDVYKGIIEDLDEIAQVFLEMQKDSIAAIFRPLHEAGGQWFWWSINSGEQYKALYRLIYDRLVNVNGVRNLIWVYNPELNVAEEWNPGEDVYDVIAIDIYNQAFDYKSNFRAFENLKNITGGRKIVAMSECGPIPDVDNIYEDNAMWSWWMPWYSSFDGPDPAKTSNDEWKKNMADQRIITFEDLPGWNAEKYEAELAELVKPQKSKNETYPALIVIDNSVSGKGYVNIREGSLKFSDINVETAGKYVLSIYSRNSTADDARTNDIFVNEKKVGSVNSKLNTYWDRQTIDVTLDKGVNTISIAPGWGWIHIDYILLAPVESGVNPGSSSSKASSSSSTAKSSDSKVSSSSSKGKSSSSTKVSIPLEVSSFKHAEGEFLVFDMQGILLGRINIARGMPVQSVLKAKFHASSVYLIRQGTSMYRIAVR